MTPEALIARWQLGAVPRVVQGAAQLSHLFGELYRVPEKIRISYFKVKILELLLYLEAMPLPPDDAAPPYFYKSQMEKIKAIRDYLAAHLAEHFTQEALSRQFDIPMTPMKNCFRAVYGAAIGAWLTEYRMRFAAELLTSQPALHIAEIGCQVGYDNAGKFTQAFKRVLHMTPSAYRREKGAHHEP